MFVGFDLLRVKHQTENTGLSIAIEGTRSKQICDLLYKSEKCKQTRFDLMIRKLLVYKYYPEARCQDNTTIIKIIIIVEISLNRYLDV